MAFIGTAIGGIGGALLAGTATAGALGLGGASLGALALGGAALGSSIGSSLDSQSAAKKAGQMAQNLTYQPIDLKALQAQAQQNAQENLANSIKLEQQYFPQAAAARAGTQNLVAQQVAQGGRLTPDVSNAVTRAAMASGGAGGFGAGPLAAANLGLTSQQQINNAISQGENLTNYTTAGLPISGLDPGSLASAAIGQNQQQNQFNIDKTGLLTNALQSQANATSGLSGSLMGAANIYGNMSKLPAPVVPALPSNLSGVFTNQSPFTSSNLSAISTTTPTFVNPFGGR
jgi:hypothetical protein